MEAALLLYGGLLDYGRLGGLGALRLGDLGALGDSRALGLCLLLGIHGHGTESERGTEYQSHEFLH